MVLIMIAKLLNFCSKTILGYGARKGDHVFVRNCMVTFYVLIAGFCVLKDPATRNTALMTTGGIVSALCSVNAYGAYFGNSTAAVNDPTNPGF